MACRNKDLPEAPGHRAPASPEPPNARAVDPPPSSERNDAVLRVGAESFPVNRERLARHSPYFRALFLYGGGGGGDGESGKLRVEIKGVGAGPFRALMEHARTSRLALSRDNVLGVLETADFLQLERARLLCSTFLARELHLSNCLGMMGHARQRGCWELYAAARHVALTHLPAVVASDDDFLRLSKESVADLLASDDLFVPREDLVLEAILRWVTFDPRRREEDFLELVGLVRPESLTLSYVTKLLTEGAKGSDPRARLIWKLNEHLPACWTMGRSLPRSGARESLYVLGGRHDQDKQALYRFHPRSGRWQSCAPLRRKNLTQYSVAAVGDNVVVTGGYFRDEVVWYSVDWVRTYQCVSQRWVEGPALRRSRHSHGSVGLGEEAFVLGGSADEGPVADVERLVLGAEGEEEGWTAASPMVRAVERAACAALRSCVYVACGLDENGEAYAGVQRYRVKDDQWDVVSYCPLPRYDLLATELNGALYLFGGQALRLDVETDEWTTLEEECLDGKFFGGCATVSGQIYLLGERKMNKALPNMVLLDPYTDTCVEVDNAIPCPVPLRGSVTVRLVT